MRSQSQLRNDKYIMKLVQCTDISERFSEDFYQRFVDSNQVMKSTWHYGVANARLEFSEEARFQIFSQK